MMATLALNGLKSTIKILEQPVLLLTRSWYFFLWMISFYASLFNLFQLRVALHVETSHLFCSANQMTGFYMKRNTGQI